MNNPSFCIISKDFSGLGFAKLVLDAGYQAVIAYEPDEEGLKKKEEYMTVGKNYVPRVPLKKMFGARDQYKGTYWIPDGNHYPKISETLMKEGHKVWPGGLLQDRMEHDRQFAVELVKKAGIQSPETLEFENLKDGIDFLNEHPDDSFVFKPDDQSGEWDTFVPDSEKDENANEELVSYLSALPQQSGGFILQRRIKGVEANFEIWVKDGKPFFAFCELESKRKLNDDWGPLVGGAQDVNFLVPLDCAGIQKTVLPLLNLKELKGYTGFLDMNVIIADREVYFLEFCARFGYPSHPTLFNGLAIRSFPDIMMDMMDGKIKNFEENFKLGFAAGITVSSDKPKKGMPVYVSEDIEKTFFPYEIYREQDRLYLAGFGEEVGVVVAHGYTLKEAAEECLKRRNKINYPNRGGRSDLEKSCYPSSPQLRYDALKAMKYV